MKKTNLSKIIESLLFVSGEEGMTISNLCTLLPEFTQGNIELELQRITEQLELAESVIRIKRTNDTYKFVTKEAYNEYLIRYSNHGFNDRISTASLETLIITAYNEPVTKRYIEEIRGVASDQSIRSLLSRGLLELCGRSDEIGRPMLYRTTSLFLDYVGLESLTELPELTEYDIEHIDRSTLFDFDITQLDSREVRQNLDTYFQDIDEEALFDEIDAVDIPTIDLGLIGEEVSHQENLAVLDDESDDEENT